MSQMALVPGLFASSGPTGNLRLAGQLRKLAEGLDGEIRRFDRSSIISSGWTRKRGEEAEHALAQWVKWSHMEAMLNSLADLHDRGEASGPLSAIKNKATLEEVYNGRWGSTPSYNQRLLDIGCTSADQLASLRSDLMALIHDKASEIAQIAKRRKEDLYVQMLIGTKSVPDFFPTPDEVIWQMLGVVPIYNGAQQRVLEPSAGAGHIARHLRDNYGCIVDVVERNHTLSEHLKADGFNLVAGDILEYKPEQKYERIFMNPPFSSLQDIAHVRHCFEHCLEEGGYLAAITGNGWTFNSSKKAVAFREFIEDHVICDEKLPSNSFARFGTNVEARLLVLTK